MIHTLKILVKAVMMTIFSFFLIVYFVYQEVKEEIKAQKPTTDNH